MHPYLVLQIFGMIISLTFVIILFFKKSDKEQKFMISAFTCTLIYSYGIYTEYTAQTLPMACMGIRMQYFGSCFLPLFIIIFSFHHCRVRLPKVLLITFLSLELIVFICAMTCNMNNFLYSDMSLETGDALNHLTLRHGSVWYLYFFTNVVIALLISGVSVYRISKTPKGGRYQYFLLLVSCLIPDSGYLLFRSGLTGIYDLTPTLYLCVSFILYYSIYRLQFFGLIDSARDEVIDNMSEALIIVDKKLNIIDYNSAARFIFPLLRSKKRERKITENALLYRLFTDKNLNEFEYDGRFYKRYLNELRSKGSNVLGYFIVISDITQTHNYVNELINARATAQNANETKSRYLANASHELRTPMNAIVGFSDLILMNNPPENIKDYVHDINNAAHSLLAIVNDILDISKIEAGKLEIQLSEYATAELLENVCSIIRLQAQNKQLNFYSSVDGNLPSMLCGDVVHLRQIMINLLGNAVKYTDIGEVSIKISQSVKPQLNTDIIYLLIRISDTGVGIKKEDIPRLFNEFERVEQNVTSGNNEGTGLGLAITKNLVDMMDGELTVESVVGEGSVFTVIIPQKVIDPTSISDSKDKGFGGSDSDKSSPDLDNRKSFYAPDARILVTDDSLVNLKLITSILEGYQISADTASSGQAALSLLHTRNYDLVFMDHMMPGMDGIETTSRIRRMGLSDLKIVALTANAVIGAREMFLENGMDDFLSKPIDIAKLEGLLLKYLPKDLVHYYEKAIDEKEAMAVDLRSMGLNIPGNSISPADGYNNCMKNIETYTNILETFLRTGRTSFAELETAIRTKDYKKSQLITHTLKNSAYTIGALKTSTLAKEAEAALKSDNIALFDLKSAPLLDAYQEVLNDLSAYFTYRKMQDEKVSFNKPEPSLEIMSAKLKDLMDELRQMDSVLACETIDFLSDHSYKDKKISAALVSIRNDILDFEYDNAKKKLSELMKYLSI